MSKRFLLDYYNGVPRILDTYEESFYTISDPYLLGLLNVMDSSILERDKRIAELEKIAKAAKEVSEKLSKTEIIDIDDKEYNVWSIVGDAEKDELAAALKGNA